MYNFNKHSDFFKLLFDQSIEANIILDRDTIIYCNKAAYELFGFTSENDLLGKNPWHLSPEYQKNEVKSKESALSKLSPSDIMKQQKFDWLHIHNDGSEFESEISMSRIDFEGNILIHAIIRDISTRKGIEVSLLKEKENAEESTRLKTSFLANMSHDIRTPLNAILGFSKMLAEDEDVSVEERMNYGSLIESNSNNLLNLINDIIDISKIEANQIKVKKSSFRLNSLLEELYLTFKKEILGRENIKLKLNLALSDHSYAIFSDPMRIKQVLSNLLTNAIKYTEEGTIEFGYEIIEDNMLHFFVKDTGFGIAPEQLESIFNRFHREEKPDTKNIRGTGLGLDISKSLVELLSGKIWAFSRLHIGSEFYFSIPIVSREKLPFQKKSIRSQGVSAHSINWSDKHILIADDDIINFELLRIILSKTKVKITKAVNGKEALDYILKDESIDLMLLDIQMPVMNGYEAIREIRKVRPKLPVIAQTAVSLEYGEDVGSSDKFDDFVSKPIDVESLLNKISIHLPAKAMPEKGDS